MNHPCYKPGVDECVFEDDENEPCWGEVQIRDETCYEDYEGNHECCPYYSCKGHANMLLNGKYKSKPIKLGDKFYKEADRVGGTETSGLASGEPLTKIAAIARLAEHLGYDEKADREIDALIAKAREKEKMVPMIPVSEEGNKLVDELLNQNLDKDEGNNVLQTWQCYCYVRYPLTVLRCSDCGQMVPVSREKELTKVLKNLVNRLEEMEKPINGCITISSVHGCPYPGPTWEEPLAAAKKILND